MNHVTATTAAALLLLAGAAGALESDQDKPIELTADFADIDESKGRSLYRGNVDIRQGTMQLLADEVTILHSERRPTRMIAEGRPVKFRQQTTDGTVRGEARRAEYEMSNENLVLIGDAVVYQNQDTMRSDRIVYDRVKSVVKAGAAADGQSRVRITIQPPAK